MSKHLHELHTRLPSAPQCLLSEWCLPSARSLSWNGIGVNGAKALATALQGNAVLTVCTLTNNKLDVETAKLLAEIGTVKRIMLSGIKHDQTEADFLNHNLTPADSILIASDLRVTRVLTKLW